MSHVKANLAAFYGTTLYVALSLHHRVPANITSQVLLFLPWLVSDIATSFSSTLAVHGTALCLGEGDLPMPSTCICCTICFFFTFIRCRHRCSWLWISAYECLQVLIENETIRRCVSPHSSSFQPNNHIGSSHSTPPSRTQQHYK